MAGLPDTDVNRKSRDTMLNLACDTGMGCRSTEALRARADAESLARSALLLATEADPLPSLTEELRAVLAIESGKTILLEPETCAKLAARHRLAVTTVA